MINNIHHFQARRLEAEATHNIVSEKKREYSIALGKPEEFKWLAKTNTLQKGMLLESPCHLTHLNRTRGPGLQGAPAVEGPPSSAKGLTHSSWSVQSAPPALQQLLAGSFQSPLPGVVRPPWTFPPVLTARCQWAPYTHLETLGLQHEWKKTRRAWSEGCTKSSLVWPRASCGGHRWFLNCPFQLPPLPLPHFAPLPTALSLHHLTPCLMPVPQPQAPQFCIT